MCWSMTRASEWVQGLTKWARAGAMWSTLMTLLLNMVPIHCAFMRCSWVHWGLNSAAACCNPCFALLMWYGDAFLNYLVCSSLLGLWLPMLFAIDFAVGWGIWVWNCRVTEVKCFTCSLLDLIWFQRDQNMEHKWSRRCAPVFGTGMATGCRHAPGARWLLSRPHSCNWHTAIKRAAPNSASMYQQSKYTRWGKEESFEWGIDVCVLLEGFSTHFVALQVTEEIEGMRFNTAISAMMEFINAATKVQYSELAL